MRNRTIPRFELGKWAYFRADPTIAFAKPCGRAKKIQNRLSPNAVYLAAFSQVEYTLFRFALDSPLQKGVFPVADFLSSSLCRGRRIRLIESLRIRPRSHLVARLMQERNVPRFIVAPFGSGKTCLALDYAQTVFGLEHVSWIDGRSPCFLRDLDGNRLVDRLAELDPSLGLVVFDDVPRLNSARADEFSRVIDDLLARSCEVLVATTPTCDACSRRHADRIRIGCDQLLASERDLDWSPRLADGSDRVRIPLLAWGPSNAADQLVLGLVQEDLPDLVTLALFVLFAVGEGKVEDLLFRLPALSEDALRVLVREYPALGISEDLERFEAASVSVAALYRAFLPRLDPLASHAQVPDRSQLVSSVAQVLLDAGNRSRACDLIRAFCLRRAAADWLALHLDQLSGVETTASVCLLAESCMEPKGTDGQKAALAQAWRFYLMGLGAFADDRLALLLAKPRLARPIRGWAMCLGIVVAQPDRAVTLAKPLARMLDSEEGEADATPEGPAPSQPLGFIAATWGEWVHVAGVLVALVCRDANPDHLWRTASTRALTPACLDLISAMLLEQGSMAAAAHARARAQGLRGRGEMGSNPALALACARALGSPDPSVRSLAIDAHPKVVELMAWAEEELSSQAWAYRRQIANADDSPLAAGRKKALRHSSKDQHADRHIPHLRIRLLGGLAVHLDGRDISGDFLRRRKVRKLLCLLALNVGREVPRERVVQALWPEKDYLSAVKNLYSVWSSLRLLLAVGEGCPYLERSQGGYILEDAHVTVDVSRVRDLCRTLRLDTPDPAAWRTLLADFDDLATGILLPAESACPVILREREALASRMVDALLSSAEKLLAAGESSLALEFATRALEQGQEREDAYYLNMRCLLACGQREAAIGMYFRNRAFLAETLGIDPSAKVVELYRSILEDEEPQ